jgi:N-acetylmuramidase
MPFVGAASPLTKRGLDAAAAKLNADPIKLWTVVVVETTGQGFLPNRRPQILFERHIFSRLTKRRFDASHPDISASKPGGYGAGGNHQHDRLEKALAVHREAALQSASWGLGQILGSNWKSAGFRNVEDMVAAMTRGEDEQLMAMVHFLRSKDKLLKAFERADWAAFAREYNGPAYAKNQYDEKLAKTHERFSKKGLPDLDIRAAQLLLFYHGLKPGTVDGVSGKRTDAAIAAFCAKHKHPAPEPADRAAFVRVLTEALPPIAGV